MAKAKEKDKVINEEKKERKFKVSARFMGQVGYRHRPKASVNAQRHQGVLALRQARIKFRFKKGQWRAKASIDLADGISADGDRPFRYVRNAFVEWRPNKAWRLRVGNFKRPYSRLAWESAHLSPTISRGLIYHYAVRRRNTNLAYGMRGLGLMVWHKFETPLGKARVYASLTQAELDFRTISAHVLYRQALGAAFELDLYSTYKRSLIGNEGVHSNASGMSGTLQLGKLSALAEIHAMQNWQAAQKPWGLGVLGTADYKLYNREKLAVGPVLALEWLDEDLKRDAGASYRIAGGALARIQDNVAVWAQAEWKDRVNAQDPLEALSQGQLRLRLQLSVSL